MKLSALLTLSITLLSLPVHAEETLQLTDRKDITSYAIGVETARNLKKQDVELNLDLLIRGLKDGLSGERLLLPEKVLRKTMNELQTEVRRTQNKNRKELGDQNKKKGDAFLAENKKKEGVVTLPSGLQYRIVKPGEGPKPVDTDVVLVNYRGTLLDGVEFDASQEGTPAKFSLKTVIPGWREALKLMPTGSKWQVFVPAALAYGARGAGKDIGPSETLIFDVELVGITK